MSDDDLRTFYQIFCTEDIDIKILEKAVELAPHIYDDIYPDKDGRATAEFLLISTPVPEDLDSYLGLKAGTRPPIQAFKTPYKSFSLEQLNRIFSEHLVHPKDRLDGSCFFIADAQTANDKNTLLFVESVDPANTQEPIETIRVDFHSALHWAVQSDIGAILVREMEKLAGPDGVVTWASAEKGTAEGKGPKWGAEVTWKSHNSETGELEWTIPNDQL